MKRLFFLLFSLFLFAQLFCQNVLKGKVQDMNSREPLIGAEVMWSGTGIGVITDIYGNFTIEKTDLTDSLIIRYTSYKTQIRRIPAAMEYLIAFMEEDAQLLDDVTVTGRAATTVKNRYSPIETQKISGAELCRAACCNLSESFETNASVDVAYADAATGAKTIKMLGLSGTYVQLLTENTPSVRGLAQPYGMEYTPGPWMESIQVSKGTASVINGYESITGQINIEYLKPQTQDPIAINAVMNSNLGAEANITGGWEINDKLSTGIMAYYKNSLYEHDTPVASLRNNSKKSDTKDGFLDLPKSQQANLLNRWYYKKGDFTSQVFVRGLYDTRRGGQYGGEDPYRINIDTWRVEAFTKNGYVFDAEKGTSIGTILSGSYHNVNSIYGHREYKGGQGNFYMNLLFQTYFTDNHKLTAGISTNFDHYDEVLKNEKDGEIFVRGGVNRTALDMSRWEVTPGVFAEYSYTYEEKLSLLLGARIDWSSAYKDEILKGVFFTPRFNVRYSPFEWWSLRASVGMGYRSNNLLSDQAQFLPSSRKLYLDEELKQEQALNVGVSTTFHIPIARRELQLSADYYYTHFIECAVVDMEQDPHEVHFYNLNGGRAYAGNFQVEAQMEVLKGWSVDLAFRYSDVKTTYEGIGLKEKPLTNRFKALISTSYVTPLKHWQFDVTAQFNGGGRMPNPGEEKRWEDEFPWHESLMAQVTRYFRTWSIYVGAENMTNYTMGSKTAQDDGPIIGWDDPYGPNFDASMAWGPIHGWKVYAGFRWSINKK